MAATAEPTRSSERIQSLDIIRGAVMVLMVLDHVRVYSGQPAGGPTAGIFFTRWVTHFCAPAFALLAGTGAFLHGRKLGSTGALAKYLVTRGAWLVVLELTLIRASWTFNLDYATFVLAGVLWMLGWCMILLAGLVWLRPRTVGILGLAVILVQQAFGRLPRALPENIHAALGPIWNFFYPSGAPGFPGMSILYTIVPWIGVMAAGYGFGAIMLREAADRRRLCLRIGLFATALYAAFVVGFMLFAAAPDGVPKIFAALNPPKYPASQPFLLMTLGPTIALLPFLEGARGWMARVLQTFGRVPMFFYLLHIPLIHCVALAVTELREGAVHPEWYATAPFTSVPPEQRWSLSLLYLVFAVVVAALYLPCRWFAALEARRPGGWRSFF